MIPADQFAVTGNSSNAVGFNMKGYKTEASAGIKERQKAEQEKAEKLEEAEKEKAAKDKKKAAEEEKKAKKEADEAEEAEKEERKRRINERRKAEEAKESENEEQTRLTLVEKQTDKSYFETEDEEADNSADDKNKDSVTLSKTASKLSNLTTRFESVNNRLSALDKDWATDEDLAYQQLQITKSIIQQQSPAAIFSQANLNPRKVISFFQ
ncbi:MAG: hypothetical protein E3K37_16520 [Candidatus Kuenenia sp.]|nr:hypothetical protein [Candidatus Kuenenia hertensis]